MRYAVFVADALGETPAAAVLDARRSARGGILRGLLSDSADAADRAEGGPSPLVPSSDSSDESLFRGILTRSCGEDAAAAAAEAAFNSFASFFR